MASAGVTAHHPSPINTARDISFTSTKGLLNGPGQNNCFLNSAVQVLWHLDIFRRSFRDLSGHACMAESCIFCALKELFSQLQFSHETALPPDALRRALAESFFDQQRFQLGFMDDAAECFENMLLRIHMHIAHGEAEDMCNARHCIPHQKFAMTLVEQSICESCGATSEPLSFTQMVHYVSASALTTQVRQSMISTNIGIQDSFGLLLKKAGSMGDIRDCPSACGAKIQIGRALMNRPEIVSVGIVWDSERPTLEHIMDVFATVGTCLRLGDVFNSVVDKRWADLTSHNLVGVVTYYGKHYSTFFFHTKLRVWIYFDDATVREVGPRWDQVVEKCRRGRYQPLLLLYATPAGTPVSTENAPKQITPFYSEKNGGLTQSVLRRSITPSPEKPNVGNTRRAITPNPDGSLAQKPPLPRGYSEYQNLSIIQDSIYNKMNGVDVVDGDLGKEPEYITRKTVENVLNMQQFVKPQVNVQRSLSNSSSNTDGISIPDHLNVARRRDSGNWSGDRNSASSSSSTTMDNPYLYLVGKMPHGNGSLPGSPTRVKSDSSSGSSGVYDAGYDSYSLSSNDSSTMSTIQHLMKMGHLAKIPEDYGNVQAPVTMPSCDVLCDEADELLSKSRQLEDEHDLVLALALCNAAATKARAAMNAPYNNPQTLTLARMKHNTCIMRARSLHRRMNQTLNATPKENPIEIRHTREGSSGSGRHSRQSSREKGMHSRQNSRELLNTVPVEKVPTKNIEIYATLPKKKDGSKKMSSVNIEDEEYMIYDKPPGRESRSIFSRSKNKEANKIKEKRSRSEDRNKLSRDFSIAPEILSNSKDTLKREKSKEEKEEKKDKSGKKQHKIRRKLLMGGLIRRKNRSMPDLTEGTSDKPSDKPISVDDSKIGVKEAAVNMSGYLSEGHLEFNGTTTNPNLERSRLMRKSFHGSAGKVLTAAKVPPPPPLRTTSQLSASKLPGGEDEKSVRPKYPLPDEETSFYHNLNYMNYNDYQSRGSISPFEQHSTVVIRADVHQEQSPTKSMYGCHQIDSGVDEVDFGLPCLSMDLPPYPSPACSVIHSRQASEEFPPPPPPLDVSSLDEHLPPFDPTPGSLLSQLQNKRQEILSQDSTIRSASSGDTWLRELQAKQAVLRSKKSAEAVDQVNTQKTVQMIRKASSEPVKSEAKITSVKDLASRFEIIEAPPQPQYFNTMQAGVLSVKKRDENEILAAEQIAQEIREVEKLNAVVQKNFLDDENKRKLMKKKSVSFCDQVILVATADEQEDDSYIPNPILERVLRSAIHKPEAAAIRQEIISLREIELRKENSEQLKKQEDVDVVDSPQELESGRMQNLYQYNVQNEMTGDTRRESPLDVRKTNPQIEPQLNRVYPPAEVPARMQMESPMSRMNFNEITRVPQIEADPRRMNYSEPPVNYQPQSVDQRNNYNGVDYYSSNQDPRRYQNGVNYPDTTYPDPRKPPAEHPNQLYVRQNSYDNLLSRPPGMQTSLSREEREYIMQNTQQQQIYGSNPQYRQSPYQTVPNGRCPQETYSSSQRNNYSLQQVRQSPTPNGYYQHPPSPSPSTQSYNNQNLYSGTGKATPLPQSPLAYPDNKSPVHPAYPDNKSPLHPAYPDNKLPLHPAYPDNKSPLHPAFIPDSKLPYYPTHPSYPQQQSIYSDGKQQHHQINSEIRLPQQHMHTQQQQIYSDNKLPPHPLQQHQIYPDGKPQQHPVYSDFNKIPQHPPQQHQIYSENKMPQHPVYPDGKPQQHPINPDGKAQQLPVYLDSKPQHHMYLENNKVPQHPVYPEHNRLQQHQVYSEGKPQLHQLYSDGKPQQHQIYSDGKLQQHQLYSDGKPQQQQLYTDSKPQHYLENKPPQHPQLQQHQIYSENNKQQPAYPENKHQIYSDKALPYPEPHRQSPYQRVPPPHDHQYNHRNSQEILNQYQDTSPYQRLPEPPSPYQRLPNPPETYQRVPQNGYPPDDQTSPYQRIPEPNIYQQKIQPPYQHALPPKQILKKSVSFEPGTKGEIEAALPKPVVTPIIVNNNNSIPQNLNSSLKNKCNLCRKKSVSGPNLYCADCEFYMSRFKPKS